VALELKIFPIGEKTTEKEIRKLTEPFGDVKKVQAGGHMLRLKSKSLATFSIVFLASAVKAAGAADISSVACDAKSKRIEGLFSTESKKIKQVLPVLLPLSSLNLRS
jgi:hypothetical protein